MRVSCNWLNRHVDLSGVDLEALGRRFTMAVAELDGVEHVGHGLDHVVIGHVRSVEPIAGKKVRLTSVDCGPHGVRAIVCGAANVAAGQHVAVALPGQRLGDMTIAVSEVAGHVSEGMICSERELGLSEEHAGILVLSDADAGGASLRPGDRLDATFPVRDTIFVIDNKSLTHRPDCWGHRGIAREVAALIERPLRALAPPVAYTAEAPLTLQVGDLRDCPRYTATCMEGVTVGASPLWLRLLLARSGMRSISNVVDATNFVMLDLGNPLHAFDRRAVRGDRLEVRRARDGEVFETLDGQPRELAASDVVIADAEGAVALAGVMGGLASGVAPDTTALVLEAAAFDPGRVRMTAQRLGLRTESSARFEKSLDPTLPRLAAASFAALMAELCPGLRVTSALQEVAAPDPSPVVIATSCDYIRGRLGHALPDARIVGILTALAFEVHADKDGALRVTVPSWRATKDIGIPDDLVEEVGRVFGYDNIPPSAPEVVLSRPEANTRKRFERTTRSYLALSAGLDELQTYSFDDESWLGRMGLSPTGPRERLMNPISAEMPFMRRHLDAHLLAAMEKNARTFETVQVFEIGRVFLPSEAELPEQPTMLGLGLLAPPAWARDASGAPSRTRTEPSHFMALKGILEGLAEALDRAPLRFVRGGPGLIDRPWAHPVRQATVYCGDVMLGVMAELHPALLTRLDVTQHGALAELDLDRWRACAATPLRYRPLPRFPAVYRDFALVVPRAVEAATMADAIRLAAPSLVEDVALQSVYEGPGVPEGDKSVAWSVTLRLSERTLVEADVRSAEDAIWAAAERIGARPRVAAT